MGVLPHCTGMKVFHCDHCGQLLFFENVVCLRCGRRLGYAPDLVDMVSLDATSDEGFTDLRGRRYRLCRNDREHAVCNWLLGEGDPGPYCVSCRLTRTIPNLEKPGNSALWYKLEVGKRRLVYTLVRLRLPLVDKTTAPDTGLAFDLLEDPEPSTPVLTGHEGGVITVSLAEADDAERTKRRLALGEPYRTLLGHFRHESGHYYWDRLVGSTPVLSAFRARFGDERADYREALARHYAGLSPIVEWQDGFVSAYATVHPWEDFAETWAHYLHMVDTLEMAAACGVSVDPPHRDEPRVERVPDPAREPRLAFSEVLEGWTTITYVLNNLNRGLGTDDPYPFVLGPGSIEKLRFVHELVAGLRA